MSSMSIPGGERGSLPGTARERGFSLLELAIATVLLAVVTGAAGAVMMRSQLLFDTQVQQYVVDDSGLRVVNRLTQELRGAEPTSVLPLVLDDSEIVQFQRVTGFVDGAVVLGPVITVEFQLAAGETANGVDDNGDGRTDEGRIVFTEAGNPPRVLAVNVVGLRFNSTADGLSFSIDLQLIDRNGRSIARTFTQEVGFRN